MVHLDHLRMHSTSTGSMSGPRVCRHDHRCCLWVPWAEAQMKMGRWWEAGCTELVVDCKSMSLMGVARCKSKSLLAGGCRSLSWWVAACTLK